MVFKNPPATITELQERIEEACEEVSEEMYRTAYRSVFQGSTKIGRKKI
jgi:hypothetical protein